jgi:hypothetical protein
VDKKELLEMKKNPMKNTKKALRITGGGRRPVFPHLESQVVQWVKDLNKAGVNVRDEAIKLKAKQLYSASSLSLSQSGASSSTASTSGTSSHTLGGVFSSTALESDTPLLSSSSSTLRDASLPTSFTRDTSVAGFKFSTGWVNGFKNRHNLCSRRHTSGKVLPNGVTEICREFLTSIHNLIQEKQIKCSNILNLDQVPRVFGAKTNSTITERGCKNVLLRAAGSAHKKFTVTFCISGSGQVLPVHLLFSKLTKIPEGLDCMVNVNRTGMWSGSIMRDYLQDMVMKRSATLIRREPILFIIDSYASHLPFENSSEFEEHNIYIRCIPGGLTGILQPLDVCFNRGFQAYYSTQLNAYMEDAAVNGNNGLLTKKGNIKIPSYKKVAKWCTDYPKSLDVAAVAKAFTLVGITGVDAAFPELNSFHEPLRNLIINYIDELTWLNVHWELVQAECKLLLEDLTVEGYYFPEDNQSFYTCISREIKEDLFDLKQRLVTYMKSREVYLEALGPGYLDRIIQGLQTVDNLEIKATSQMLKWSITVRDFKNCSAEIFRVAAPEKFVELVKIDNYYIIRYII